MKPYQAPICANVDELTTLLDAMETQLAIEQITYLLLTFSFSESQLFSFFPHPPPEPGRPPVLLSFLLTFSLSAFQNFSFYPQNGGGRGVGFFTRLNHEPKRKKTVA